MTGQGWKLSNLRQLAPRPMATQSQSEAAVADSWIAGRLKRGRRGLTTPGRLPCCPEKGACRSTSCSPPAASIDDNRPLALPDWPQPRSTFGAKFGEPALQPRPPSHLLRMLQQLPRQPTRRQCRVLLQTHPATHNLSQMTFQRRVKHVARLVFYLSSHCVISSAYAYAYPTPQS